MVGRGELSDTAWAATEPLNVVERCVNRLKQWRGIATRYEKRHQLPGNSGHR